jgi:hypothetical protein
MSEAIDKAIVVLHTLRERKGCASGMCSGCPLTSRMGQCGTLDSRQNLIYSWIVEEQLKEGAKIILEKKDNLLDKV